MLIIISNDAMVYEDIPVMEKFPAFRRFLDFNCRADRVHTIWPSLTHPVHATMITGAPAGVTGIISNEICVPGQDGTPWFNDLKQIRCDTLLHACRRAGLVTCSCRWPVTGGDNGVVDYLLPEVIGEPPVSDPEAFYRGIGCGGMLDIVLRHAHETDGLGRHPAYDDQAVHCLCDVIREKKVDLCLTHLGLPDAFRHQYGVFSDRLEIAYAQTDAMLTELFDAVEQSGKWDETDWLLVSDHGQLPIVRSVALNAILREKGLLETNADGTLAGWRAYAHSTGLSAQIYVSDPAYENEVYRVLGEMARDGLYGFSQVLTADEARERYGLYGDFRFAVETDGFTSFSNSLSRPFVRPLDPRDYRFGRATHGHMPEKGPQPTLLAMGPSFKRDAVLKNIDILDEAPLAARVLGVTLNDARGKAPLALLK